MRVATRPETATSREPIRVLLLALNNDVNILIMFNKLKNIPNRGQNTSQVTAQTENLDEVGKSGNQEGEDVNDQLGEGLDRDDLIRGGTAEDDVLGLTLEGIRARGGGRDSISNLVDNGNNDRRGGIVRFNGRCTKIL